MAWVRVQATCLNPKTTRRCLVGGKNAQVK